MTVLLAALLTTPTAHAEAFRGAACNTHSTTLARTESGGGFYNQSTSAMDVYCAPSTGTYFSALGGTDTMTLYVLDQHYSQNLSCTFYARTTATSSYGSASSSGSSSSVSGLSMTATIPVGYYWQYAYCAVPPYYSSSSNYSGVWGGFF